MSDERLQAFIERTSRAYGEDEKRYVEQEGVARIPVVGALTKTPDFYFSMFGGGNAVYGDVIEGIRGADGDPAVKQIVLEIDSPGGEVEGLQGLLDVIAGAKTEIIAQVTDKALSSAYAIASQADSIVVNNSGAQVGSVGIMISQYVDENVVITTSSEAPLKNPRPDTPEGAEAVQEMLDRAHQQFVEGIADGRSRATGKDVTPEKVNAKYGRGATVYAADALKLGMIDGIAKAPKARAGKVVKTKGGRVAADNTNSDPQEGPMDRATLIAEYRQLFDDILAEGRAIERKQVTAHLMMGESSGAMEAARGFIEEGTDFGDPVVQATYQTAAINRGVVDASSEDDDDSDSGDAPTDDKELAENAKWSDVMDGAARLLGLAPPSEGVN